VAFEIEHVIPKQHGGPTTLLNLAYSCLHCNRHKGPNLAGLERIGTASTLVPLFHPRRHKWDRHFRWSGPILVGRTPVGRVTIQVLDMNDPRASGPPRRADRRRTISTQTARAPLTEPGPINLQDHNSEVRYRNVWFVEK
jgi:hypothetical protein